VLGVNEAAKTIVLGDPNKRGETILVSEEEFKDNFGDVAYNPLK
jgi:hypothetical protein